MFEPITIPAENPYKEIEVEYTEPLQPYGNQKIRLVYQPRGEEQAGDIIDKLQGEVFTHLQTPEARSIFKDYIAGNYYQDRKKARLEREEVKEDVDESKIQLEDSGKNSNENNS